MAKKVINIKLGDELWQQARIEALKQGVTMQDWLTDAIQQKLQSSKVKTK